MTGDFLDDPALTVYFALLYGAGISLLGRSWAAPRLTAVVLAFAGWTAVSAIWSINPARSATLSGLTILATLCALRVGTLAPHSVALASMLAHQGGIAASIGSWAIGWGKATNAEGDWVGVYFNRNSLAPVAAFAAISSVGWLMLKPGPMRRFHIALVGALCALDLGVLIAARSVTSVMALTAVAVATVGYQVVVRGPRRGASGPSLALIGTLALSTAVAIFAFSSRSPSLSGRTQVWSHAWDWILERPLRGWGWMAIWTDSVHQWALPSRLRFRIPTAHNGFVEALVGTGVVGLVLLLAVVAVSAWSVLRRPSSRTPWLLACAVWFIVVNLTETFVGANHVAWMMFIAAGTAAEAAGVRPKRHSDRKQRRALMAHTGPIEPGGTSGSAIRPYRMLTALTDSGVEVDSLSGTPVELAQQYPQWTVKKLRELDFVYLELESSSFFITLRRSWKALLGHVIFLLRLRRADVPTGYFVRDVYWEFPDLTPKGRMVGRLAEMLERRLLTFADVVFVPTAEVGALLPPRESVRARPLPPGTSDTASRKDDGPAELPIRLLYAGNVTPPTYDISPLIDLAEDRRLQIVVACSESVWTALSSDTKAAAGSAGLEIHHPTQAALTDLMRGADAAIVQSSAHPYLQLAFPVKAAHALSERLPIVALDPGVIATFAYDNRCGWLLNSESAIDSMIDDLTGPRARQLAARVDIVASENSWIERARSVAQALR